MKLYLWDRSWAALRRVRHRMNRSRRPAIPGAGQRTIGLQAAVCLGSGWRRLFVAALATLRGRDAGAAPRASSCSAQYRWNVVLPQRSRGPPKAWPARTWCRHVHQGVEATERQVCRTPGGAALSRLNGPREQRDGGTVGTQARPDIQANAIAPARRPPQKQRDRASPTLHRGLICINAGRRHAGNLMSGGFRCGAAPATQNRAGGLK